MSLAWTKDAPEERGYWLYGVADRDEIRLYEFYDSRRGLRCDAYPRFKTLRGLWYGPVASPIGAVSARRPALTLADSLADLAGAARPDHKAVPE